MNARDHVDVDTLDMLREVMEDGFAHLLETYLNDADMRMAALREAIAGGDTETVRREAHSLKGSSSNLGASPMAELCFQMETKGREGNLDGAEVLLTNIDDELKSVSQILRGLLENQS